jgi:steroid delta-isomerase-like uncharacterized protein
VSVEEPKALASRWTEEIWNRGNMAAVDELCAPSFVFNYPAPGVTSDREGYKKTVTMFRDAFHDMQLTNEIVIAEGDMVALRWKGRSVHRGDFMGIAPTGKQVTMTGNTIGRVAAGKFVEEWTEMDMMTMMQQLGVMPPMG